MNESYLHVPTIYVRHNEALICIYATLSYLAPNSGNQAGYEYRYMLSLHITD